MAKENGATSLELLSSRRDEFNELHETLLKQAAAIEEKLGTLAQEFNEAAEKLQATSTPQSQPEAEPAPATNDDEKTKTKSRRRAGMFGNELTLDD